MRRLIWIGGAALTASVLLATAACASGNKAGGTNSQRAIFLTLAGSGSGSEAGQLELFANQVRLLSRGLMRIKVEQNWRARDPHQEIDTIRDVKAGKADLGWAGAGAWDSLGVHNFDPLIAPMLIDSYPLEQEVFAAGIPKRMLAGVRQAGLVGIGVLPGAMEKVLGVRRRLVSPADFRGLRFGVQGIVAAETFRALGARSEQIFARERLTGLSGVESPLGPIVADNYGTAKSYLGANLNLGPRPLVLFASPRIFRSLNGPQRRILRAAAAAAVSDAIVYSRTGDPHAIDGICARHRLTLVNLTSRQHAMLAHAVAPVYERLLRNPSTRRAISQIRSLRRGMPTAPAIRCPPASAPSGGVTANPLDGVYEVQTTAADLRRAVPQDDTPIVAENWGRWVFVFAGNRLAYTQQDRRACTWAYGRVHVHGQAFSWTILDGGYTKAPNDAYNVPGEAFRFQWSRYHDSLTLSAVPGAVSPENFRALPWHRVSTQPSRTFFSSECPPPRAALP